MNWVLLGTLAAAGLAASAPISTDPPEDGETNPPPNTKPVPPSNDGGPKLDMVKGTWGGKAFTLSCDIQTGRTARSDFNDEVLYFSAPNIYGSTRQCWALVPDAVASLRRIQARAREQGRSIMVVDTLRSKKKQAQLKKDKPGLAASVDASFHPRGRAIDVRCYNPQVSVVFDGNDNQTFGSDEWLRSLFLDEGWVWPNPREAWHVEYRKGA